MQRKKSTKLIRCASLGLLLTLTLTLCTLASERGPWGLSLSWTGDTATTITMTWRDDTQEAEVVQVVSKLQYDKTDFARAEEFTASCKDLSLDGSGAWHYEATAAGLTPATVYVYRVGRGGSWSNTYTFTTGDPGSNSLTFLYMGDIQPNSDVGFSAWGALAKAAYQRNPELKFGLLGGDIVDNGTSLDQFDSFRTNAENAFANIPLLATNGNHESNFPETGKPELYLNVFAFPANGPKGFFEEFYSFDYANCHILVLNSWIFSDEQKLTDADIFAVNDWIRADLAASKADWQIVVTHVPVYAVFGDTTATAVKKNWAPIFEDYGVDLVFVGHQHVYSRSYPMYKDKVDYENGVTYIMGVSGPKFYSSADELYSARTICNTANYQLARIDSGTLTVQTLDAGGNELDYCTINRRDISMTRAEYVTTLWKAAGSPTGHDAHPFIDVPPGSADEKAIAWAYDVGLIYGYGGSRFGPKNKITREQVSLILSRKEDNAA